MRKKIKSITGSTETKVSRKGKTLGTRAGILRDWREASGKTIKDSRSRPDSMRDGR